MVEILKTHWGSNETGWIMTGMNGIQLRPRDAEAVGDYFQCDSSMASAQSGYGSNNVYQLLNSFGSTDSLLKQSIVPVVALVRGATNARCIGTAFVISCSGYIATACHVLLDPIEEGYGNVRRRGSHIEFPEEIEFGVVIPLAPALGGTKLFFPLEAARYWGEWQQSPLVHERDRFRISTDIAICKIPHMPRGMAHQPLNLSLHPVRQGEDAIAIGYSEMANAPIEYHRGQILLPTFDPQLFVSTGVVENVFFDNHLQQQVPTPGPCFDFGALVPGKMSGGPIIGGDGTVVRGIVSRSYAGERHASGAMLSAAIDLEVTPGVTLRQLIESGTEGMTRVQAARG